MGRWRRNGAGIPRTGVTGTFLSWRLKVASLAYEDRHDSFELGFVRVIPDVSLSKLPSGPVGYRSMQSVCLIPHVSQKDAVAPKTSAPSGSSHSKHISATPPFSEFLPPQIPTTHNRYGLLLAPVLFPATAGGGPGGRRRKSSPGAVPVGRARGPRLATATGPPWWRPRGGW